jgi:CHAT domain-containing protein
MTRCTFFVVGACLLLGSFAGIAQSAPYLAGLKQIDQARAELHAAETAHPGNSPEVADHLDRLVYLQIEGRVANSETLDLAQRELAIAKVVGPNSRVYVQALATLCNAYISLGHPEEGRPLGEQAAEISQKEFPRSAEAGLAADALGTDCMELGDFPCALQWQEQAVATLRGVFGEFDIHVANALQDLGLTRMSMGQNAAAEITANELLDIATHLDPSDLELGNLENNAGGIYAYTGHPEKAIPHLARALELIAAAYGSDNVEIAYTRSNLADAESRTGQFAPAWKDFREALPGYQRWLGAGNTLTSNVEATFGKSLAAGGDWQEALKYSLQAEEEGRRSFQVSVQVLPERQALAYDQRRAAGIDVALSVALKHPDMPLEEVYTQMIRSRALVADEMARRQQDLNRANDPETARLIKELNAARSAVMALDQTQPSKPVDPEAATQATERMEQAERALAERSARFRSDQQASAVTLEEIRSHLPPHSVLVSYVQYGRYAVGKVDPAAMGVSSYLAFVYHPDTNALHIFDLGPTRPIGQMVDEVRNSVDSEMKSRGLGSVRNERAYRAEATKLREKIWDPLAADLAGAKFVMVVPDWKLNLVPFAALPEGKGYMVEHGPVIHMLSTERDLVAADGGEKKKGLLAIGDPTFGKGESATPGASSTPRGMEVSCEEFRKMIFHSLPDTAAEIADVSAEWKQTTHEPSEAITGVQATRESFLREVVQYRMAHVATHAFLLSQDCGDGNPLLHSGLVFAGANTHRESSLLTAQQIASLDMSGLDWAVLSACSTGSGKPLQDGEGVLGLERAFRVAGARSVIMTLWPVDDNMARRFTHELYRNRLGRHDSTADSVWGATRTLLQQRRASGQSTHPWYWAGFVGSGAWQ